MAGEGMGDFEARQTSDQEFLDLRRTGDDSATFVLTQALARPDGRLYGGTALASAVTASEMITDRPVLWSTVQFVANDVSIGDTISMTIEELAAGRRTSQVRIAAHANGRLLFTALGSNALPKAEAIEGVFVDMPAAPRPEDCDPMMLRLPAGVTIQSGDRTRNLEMKVARRQRGERESLMWGRVPGRPATPAIQGYVGDFVPTGVVNAAGRIGAGISLDNSLRSVAAADTEWVLLHLVAHAAGGGFGTGQALMWSEDGRFLGLAHQTSTAFAFD